MTDALELPSNWQQIVTVARTAREAAYAPYSKFHVGAAVVTKSGQVFSGCNVENASYGLTICAERVAVCSAVAAGDRQIEVVCISLTGHAVPCGACRQFLYEFQPQMLLLLDNPEVAGNVPEVKRLSDLLPDGFRLN